MKHLQAYIDSVNWVQRLMKQPEFDINNLDQAKAGQLFDQIDGGLSPENLCCDGELSLAKVRKKKRMLEGAAAELHRQGYRPTGPMYCLDVPS